MSRKSMLVSRCTLTAAAPMRALRAGAWIGLVWMSAACRSISGECKVETDAGVAPDSFLVRFETSRGPVDAMVRKAWSPAGAAHLHTLLKADYFDDARFFRVLHGFVAQFGMAGDPAVNARWETRCIADEPVKHTNARGTLVYARGGPKTRANQLFINLVDNPKLDQADGFGFPPVANVVSGMEVVDSLYSGYGDEAPRSGAQFGREGPAQDSIGKRGNAYLAAGWPKLDYIKTARITTEWP